MIVERFVNNILKSNTYVVYKNGFAIIIDIGDFEPIYQYVKKENLTVQALFLTHTHYDHIYGIKEFLNLFPNIPIYTSEFGKKALLNSKWNLSRYHNNPIEIDSVNIHILKNNQIVHLLDDDIKVIATPGHDKSCLCYLISNCIFTGDSYIPNFKVISTLPQSDKYLADYWYRELEKLSSVLQIYPGHSS